MCCVRKRERNREKERARERKRERAYTHAHTHTHAPSCPGMLSSERPPAMRARSSGPSLLFRATLNLLVKTKPGLMSCEKLGESANFVRLIGDEKP